MKNILFRYKGVIKGVADIVGWSVMTVFAFALRFDGNLTGHWVALGQAVAVLLPLKLVLILVSKSYRQSWRNTGFSDLFRLAGMVTILTIPYFLVVLVGRPELGIPLSIPIIEFFLSLLFLSGTRAATRFFIKYRVPGINRSGEVRRILIAGAGESGVMVAKEIQKDKHINMVPVAFVDDDLQKRKQSFAGVPVKGTIYDIPAVVRKMNINEVIIAMPSESGEVIQRVVGRIRQANIHFRIIPAIYDLVSGKVTINQIRDVDVEDLLRRKPIVLETKNIEQYINGKRVLVTGAGGSIGSEIVRQIARFRPEHVILLGRGENSIHQLVLELRDRFPLLSFSIRICDVRDEVSLKHIFSKDKPEVIFHAAAHKHVPIMEENPAQAILNNVCGTRNLVNLAIKYHISHFVNISTDKAVNPTSVMGATKRITEMIVEWGAEHVKNDSVFVSVRFGNVLGSRGSVIPIFKNQIKKGGPVKVTHPDMIRYFMTIPEASQLVLQAGAFNTNGAVYVLDMGEPVNIEQMARELIKLSGFEPDVDIKIEFTGIRPGEKLFEELLTDEEVTCVTRHNKIMTAKKSESLFHLQERLNTLIKLAEAGDSEKIRNGICELVPTYANGTVSQQEPIA